VGLRSNYLAGAVYLGAGAALGQHEAAQNAATAATIAILMMFIVVVLLIMLSNSYVTI
jgi:hypothetical protein